MTAIPVPPSKLHRDPLYDDRMLTALELADVGIEGVDLRDCIVQTEGRQGFM